MIDEDKLAALNDDIYDKARVDREHLLEFLRALRTSDGDQIAIEVRAWLQRLSDDPKYDKVIFPTGDIDAILSDLTSYGRVMPGTLHSLNEHKRELRA